MTRNRVRACRSRGANPCRLDRVDQPRSLFQCCLGLGLGVLLMIGLVVGSVARADDPVLDQPEPPVRLKKKVKPQQDQRPESAQKEESKKPERPKREEPKEDVDLKTQDVQEQIREITNRISKNMSQAEERLHKNDAGEATQQAQGDIIRDLDKLIEQ